MKLRPRYGQGLMAQGYWQSSKTGGAGLHWVAAQAIGGNSDTGTPETAAAELDSGHDFARSSGHGWEGENVKWPFGHPLPDLYKRLWQPNSLPATFSPF